MSFRDAYKKLRVGMKVAMKDTGEIHEVIRLELSPRSLIQTPDIRIKLDNGEWTYHQRVRFVA